VVIAGVAAAKHAQNLRQKTRRKKSGLMNSSSRFSRTHCCVFLAETML